MSMDRLETAITALRDAIKEDVRHPRTAAMLNRYLEDLEDKLHGAAKRGEI